MKLFDHRDFVAPLDSFKRNQLVEIFMPMAHSLALRYAGSNPKLDVQELEQEGAFGIWKAVDRYSGGHVTPEKMPGYVSKAINNNILMALRKKNSYDKIVTLFGDMASPETAQGEQMPGIEAVVASQELSVEQKLVLQETIERVLSNYKLTANERTALLLTMQGFSPPEIGATLGKADGAVKSLKHRAFAKSLSLLSGMEGKFLPFIRPERQDENAAPGLHHAVA